VSLAGKAEKGYQRQAKREDRGTFHTVHNGPPGDFLDVFWKILEFHGWKFDLAESQAALTCLEKWDRLQPPLVTSLETLPG
jgi:hypothetical protein